MRFPALWFLVLAFTLGAVASGALHAQQQKDLGMQLSENPPMQTIYREPPEPSPNPEDFEVREGFHVIDSLDEFREAIKQNSQKIRMTPGIYRADKVDRPIPEKNQQHIFAVDGSNNHFDLRGVVIETPVSVQSKLTKKAHVADSWHINGDRNTFEGGYFRNVVDRRYPKFNPTENEFEVTGDGNVFRGCTFVIKGSIPYGYSDFYGKGSNRFGALDKHSFMSIMAAHTKLIDCKLYQQSYGHGVHLHKGTDGVLIKDCLFTGTLRPTNDIYKEKTGRATEYDFYIMYRGKRKIPRDQMIPLTEDAVRTYDDDKNIRVIDTTIERFRCGAQIHAHGNVELCNVTVREPGYFGFDVTAGKHGRVVMRNCGGDVAYSPLFNLTRDGVPQNSFYEVTVKGPREGVEPTDGTNLGRPTDVGHLCGESSIFVLHADGERPLPEKVRRIRVGSKKPFVDSQLTNHTTAKVVLGSKVRNSTIESVGPVEDNGKNNTVVQLDPESVPCAR